MLLILLIPAIGQTSAAAYDPQTQRPWGCRTCTIPDVDKSPPSPDPSL